MVEGIQVLGLCAWVMSAWLWNPWCLKDEPEHQLFDNQWVFGDWGYHHVHKAQNQQSQRFLNLVSNSMIGAHRLKMSTGLERSECSQSPYAVWCAKKRFQWIPCYYQEKRPGRSLVPLWSGSTCELAIPINVHELQKHHYYPGCFGRNFRQTLHLVSPTWP